MKQFTIIQDSHEKMGWNFSIFKECKAQIREHLETGDYTVKEYPNLICFERKKSTGELSINLFSKGRQFEDELKRMSIYKHRFLICEFLQETILLFPINSGVPRKYWGRLKVKGISMMKKLVSLCEEYEIQVFFCGNRYNAELKVMELIKNIIENE